MTPEMKARIALFVEKLQAMHDAEFAEKYPNLVSDLITTQPGRKYIRVVCNRRYRDSNGSVTSNGGSVYCFINAENGDILKAEGWKKPAAGKRGSIFNENCDVGVKATMYGSGLYAR